MRTPSVLTVVRYLLLDRVTYLALPWSWAAFAFVLDVAVVKITPAAGAHWVGGLAAVFLVVFVLGVQAVASALPFGLALGVSRRTYFLGAMTLAAGLATSFGAVVAVGQAVERATGGWGIRMRFFRVTDVLDGTWWQSWLTASAAFLALFAYGMWYGLVYRRNGLPGTMVFAAGQAIAIASLAATVTWTHGWPRVAHVVSTVTIPAILAGAAAILLAGGLATVRRLAV